MVDIQNHEESLKELSKTSLINNLTLILCWSAQEAGRYLELYKSYEHASPTSIRAHQATSYAEKLVEFITVPRSINKTDAVGLVSAFGSVRAAVNARPEEIGGIAGWGEKKVQRWCETVRDPFRVKKAARRGIGERELASGREPSSAGLRAEIMGVDDRGGSLFVGMEGETEGLTREDEQQVMQPALKISATAILNSPVGPDSTRPTKRLATEADFWHPNEDEEQALLLADAEQSALQLSKKSTSMSERTQGSKPLVPNIVPSQSEGLTEGMIAALAKLRKQ